MDTYELMLKECEADLRPQITDKFLETLVQAARWYGYSGDHIETMGFVRELYWMSGREPPSDDDLAPFGQSLLYKDG